MNNDVVDRAAIDAAAGRNADAAVDQVWIDVGGTFTDAIATCRGVRTSVKVLSSGCVKCRVWASEPRAVICPADRIFQTPQFWVGATLRIIDAQGRSIPLGRVTGQCEVGPAGAVRLAWEPSPDEDLRADADADLADLADLSGRLIELDAGLESPVLATRLLLGVRPGVQMGPIRVRLGTTRGTNALLTRRGADVALLVTTGFADVLRIAQQDRPDLFALQIIKPQPLTRCVIEVDERIDPGGRVITPIDEITLRSDLQATWDRGIRSLAICLLHSHASAEHEMACERIARDIGFVEISRSSEVAPLIKLVSRAETTTLDAYLNPILSLYVGRVWEQLGGPTRCDLKLMTSGGNLISPGGYRGRDCVLSGPAGGVVAVAKVAHSQRQTAAIGLDMGGTSTDVSRYDGVIGRRYESFVAGLRVLTPMMDIHTVAAGGGSICDVRGTRMTVGPDSAGARPGPACYGGGGPLTITDLNVILGRIPPSSFPIPLDLPAAWDRLNEVVTRLPRRDSEAPSPESIAESFLRIADTHMAEAVRTVTTALGSDPRSFTLIGFGGAAGQHLCDVADAIGMTSIIDHPDAGLLSALGMGLADVGTVVTVGIYQSIDDATAAALDRWMDSLRDQADRELDRQVGGDRRDRRYRFEADCRYVRTDATLPLEVTAAEDLRERFHRSHQAAYGYDRREIAVELVAIRCEVTLPSAEPIRRSSVAIDRDAADPTAGDETTQVWCDGRWQTIPVLRRQRLPIGPLPSPALVVGDHSTLWISPSWQGEVVQDDVIRLAKTASEHDAASDQSPAMLEILARRFQGIADAMGEVLRRTAISVNVKERRDYSCAVFRGDGSLVANAPHVPVHLGAMGHTVRHLIAKYPVMYPGDCYVSNDPFQGGSHLPDVTVVTPVFASEPTGGRPDFFVASRAHHAEIGGITPGSMPPAATCLAQEGVLISGFALVRDGVQAWDELRRLLETADYPSRNPAENIADLQAQRAAGWEGTRALQSLARRYGVGCIDATMKRLLDSAGDALAVYLATLPTGWTTCRDTLDDGTVIEVTLSCVDDPPSRTLPSRTLVIDFAGTAGVHPNGFNATPAIVTAAVMYVLRIVCGGDLPLCDGLLRDVDLRIPPGLLNPPGGGDPWKSAAVVAGNVETSQRIVDVLLRTLGVAAASQGTMNNLLIGDATFGYYETIGGGSGATAIAAGADAVHTHMTNTRITDPEIFEQRLPCRLLRFEIRRGSGGKGLHRGGDGMIRELQFLKPLTVSLITNRRQTAPYGINGGGDGRTGRNVLIRGSGEQDLPPSLTFDVDAGDRLRIETPGGGGWGRPERP